jgi:hypothetical protein
MKDDRPVRLVAEFRVVWEYDAPPEWYGGETDPDEMAAIDHGNFDFDPLSYLPTLPDDEVEVFLTHVRPAPVGKRRSVQ